MCFFDGDTLAGVPCEKHHIPSSLCLATTRMAAPPIATTCKRTRAEPLAHPTKYDGGERLLSVEEESRSKVQATAAGWMNGGTSCGWRVILSVVGGGGRGEGEGRTVTILRIRIIGRLWRKYGNLSDLEADKNGTESH